MNAYYKDKPNEDICSTLTGIKAIHWINEPLVCEEFIDKHIASITTTVFCAYALLLLFGFLIYIPMDIYKGTKSIIAQLVYKLLGLGDNNKKVLDAEKKKAIQMKTKATKDKNIINGRLADDLIRFLNRLKQLKSIQELLIQLRALNEDTINELNDDDKRKSKLETDVLPDFLQIKYE